MVKVTLGAPCRFTSTTLPCRSTNLSISTVWQTAAFNRLVQVLSIGDLIFLKVGTLQFVFSNLMWIQTSVSLKPCPILDESSAWKGTFLLVFYIFFLKDWCPQCLSAEKIFDMHILWNTSNPNFSVTLEYHNFRIRNFRVR